MSRNRNWCFTLNNYTLADEQLLFEFVIPEQSLYLDGQHELVPRQIKPATIMDDSNKPPRKCYNVTYLVCGKEIGESGTPHLQGYIEFQNARSLSGIKKIMPSAHLEIRVASASQAANYCKKGEQTKAEWNEFKHNGPNFGLNANFREYGTISAQGTRTDLNEIKQEIIDGRRVDDITLSNPMLFHQYGRTLNKLEDLTMRNRFRTTQTTCTWYWGNSGVGKSHAAFENYHPSTHYLYPYDKGWWDDYTQQETVIFNDYRGELDFNFFLRLVDKFPEKVSRRGRETIPFTSKHIIVTSSKHPSFIYDPDHEDFNQLLRRITIINVTTTDTERIHTVTPPAIIPHRELTLRVITLPPANTN